MKRKTKGFIAFTACVLSFAAIFSVYTKKKVDAGKKYNYGVIGSDAINVGANLESYYIDSSWPYVGCPDTIYGYTVKSIKPNGFTNWAVMAGQAGNTCADDAKVYVPKYCTSIGANAFYSSNSGGTQASYNGGAWIPARFWNVYNSIGLTPYTPLHDNSGASIVCDTSIHGATPYNGAAQTPAAYAVYVDGVLVSDSHEFLTSDVTNVGTKTVRFPVVDANTGAANITGVFYGTASYEISKYDVANVEVGAIGDCVYNTKEQTPLPSISAPTWPGRGITKDVDCTITYENNVNAGTATMIINGINNCTGTKRVNFTIKPSSEWQFSRESIDRGDLSYTGKGIEPRFPVYIQSHTFTPGQDYDVVYKNNINAGEATAEITGKGNLTGTKVVKFNVTPTTKWTLRLSRKTFEYTGQKIQPEYVALFNETELKKVTDFTISFTNNQNVGDAVATAVGTGNFAGTKTETFTITPATNWTFELDGTSFGYTGSEIRPKVVNALLNGTTPMTMDIDYTVGYRNNVNPGDATVIVTGKGNFAGVKEVNFHIGSKLIDKDKLIVDMEDDYVFDGTHPVTPKPIVSYDGKVLVEDVDYIIRYYNNNVIGDGYLEIVGIGEYAGTFRYQYKIVGNKGDNNKRVPVPLDPLIPGNGSNLSNNSSKTSNITNIYNTKKTINKGKFRRKTIRWKKVKGAVKYKAFRYMTVKNKKGKKVKVWKRAVVTKKLKFVRYIKKGTTTKFKIKAINRKGKTIKTVNMKIRSKK